MSCVRADLPPDPRIGTGQYARVAVALGKRTAVVVPEGALVKRGQRDGVYVEEGGRLAFRIVQAGRPAGAGTREILSGLSAGEAIIYPAPSGLADGAKVEVRSWKSRKRLASRAASPATG